MNYYNENNKFAAKWLRSLITHKLIPKGDVDDRSIEDVQASDLIGYTQCHFFAGIGGWSEALRLAGWSKNRQVWTGSCPCQPFSTAGKREGFEDARHLFPIWLELIAQCQPAIIFGEQVAKKPGLQWWDEVATSLEKHHYATGSAIMPASSVGAWHIRDRLWWLADARCDDWRQQGFNPSPISKNQEPTPAPRLRNKPIAHSDHQLRRISKKSKHKNTHAPWCGEDVPATESWQNVKFVKCKDDKYRPIPLEPLFHPLADGLPKRVAKCAGFGNAIVPQLAAEFIKAFV